MINILKRHSSFFAAMGICSWLVAGIPLFEQLLDRSGTAGYAKLRGFEIAAFLVFGLALSAAIWGKQRSGPKLRLLLGIQSAAIIVMGFQTASIMTFPLLVLVAWQATLILPFRGALALIAVQTAALWIVLLPVWNSIGAMIPISLAFQFFGVFAARLAQDEAAHAQELAQVNAELRATRTLLANTVRAEERARISRELHDAWGHHLTALSLQLEYASHLATGTVRENLDEAKSLSRSLLTKVRDVVGTLCVEEGCDIARMLHELVAGLPQPAVHLNLPPDIQMPSAAHAQVVLRCIQEAITNAVKHAGAKNLWIDIRRNDDGIRIAVHDDGRGVECVRHGNGLNGMRDRFEELGGRLAIDSQVDSGFSLDGWLPHRASAA